MMMNMDNVPWCEKYRAGCFADVRGQDLAVDKVKIFLRRMFNGQENL